MSGSFPADLLIRPYRVEVRGFDAHLYYAASSGKARSQAFRNFNACHTDHSFGDFLKISRVCRADPPEGFPERITVAGRPAYRIPSGPRDTHCVVFVYPNSETILRAHPLDVAAVEKESSAATPQEPTP